MIKIQNKVLLDVESVWILDFEKLGHVDLVRILWGDFSRNYNFKCCKIKYKWIFLKNEPHIGCSFGFCKISKLGQ